MHVRLLSINEAFLACKPSTMGDKLFEFIFDCLNLSDFIDIFDSFAYPKFEKKIVNFLETIELYYMRLQAVIGPIVPICLPSISFFVLRPKFSSQNYILRHNKMDFFLKEYFQFSCHCAFTRYQ